MGKGKGKVYTWVVNLPPGFNIIEFKNLRPGRAKYFLKEMQFRLKTRTKVIFYHNVNMKLIITKSRTFKFESFW